MPAFGVRLISVLPDVFNLKLPPTIQSPLSVCAWIAAKDAAVKNVLSRSFFMLDGFGSNVRQTFLTCILSAS